MSMLVDVSHIFNWHGRLTGIERVEYHVIQHYFQKSDVQFIRWDSERQEFRAISREVITSKILDKPSQVQDSTPKQGVYSSSLSGRAVRKLRRTLLPAHTAKTLHALQDKEFVFNATDEMLILAGLWDDTHYIKAVQRVAKEQLVYHIVYDMIPIVQPQYVVDYLPDIFKHYMRSVLPLCKGIAAISQSTMKDTQDFLKREKLRVPPVQAFRLGDDIDTSHESSKPEGVKTPYFLSVSTVEARKNHQLLYYAYKKAAQDAITLPPLYIVGRRGWHTEDFQYLIENDPDVKGRIKILDGIEDQQLRWLYQHCNAVIFASFYEGWGLPVAEALGYGKVVLSSNTSSMIEIGGPEVVRYFSPFSSDELLAELISLSGKGAVEKQETIIKKRYRTKSWEDATKDLAKLIESFR